MKQGDKLNLVRHTDDGVIEITKTIKKVSFSHITFIGSKKQFEIHQNAKGELNFINGNTIYSTEKHIKPITHFEIYGAFTTIEVEQ